MFEIIFHHILLNVLAPAVVVASPSLGWMIITESGLFEEFVGHDCLVEEGKDFAGAVRGTRAPQVGGPEDLHVLGGCLGGHGIS
ncbi:hypothetical protein ACFLQ0_03900 [Nitrospinota bacterium]